MSRLGRTYAEHILGKPQVVLPLPSPEMVVPRVHLQAVQRRVTNNIQRDPTWYLGGPVLVSVLPPVLYPVSVNVVVPVEIRATGPHRRVRSLLPVVIPPAPSTPVDTTISVTLVRTRPRYGRVFRQATVVEPSLQPPDRRLTLQVNDLSIAVRTARPRRTHWFLTAVTYPQVTPIAETEVAVRLVQDDRRRRQPHSHLSPPVFYPQTSTITVALTRVRPRPTTKRLTYVTYLATSTIATHLVRTRPRPTTHTGLTPLIFYPQTSKIQTTLVRTRPRPTRHTLGPLIFYPQTSTIRTTLTRARPRPTTHTLRPLIFYPQTSRISVTTVRTRPRPTRHTGLTYVTYPQVTPLVESEIFVKTVVDDRRRRAPRSFLQPPFFYAQTSRITTALVRTRPRHTLQIVAPPVVSQPPVDTTVNVTLVRTRPRHTVSLFTPPVVEPYLRPPDRRLRVATTLVHTRPRPIRSVLGAPIFYAQTSVIKTALVRTRPRHTAHTGLTPFIFYPQTSEIQTTLVRTRPRPTHHFVTAVTYPQVTAITENEVAVKLVVDDRHRRLVHSRLQPPFIFPATSTIRVTTVRTRPRKTHVVIEPPSLAPPPVVTTLAIHTVRIRPRHTITHFTPPVVEPYLRPPDRRLEVTTTLVRIRPRPTRHTLGPLLLIKQTSTIETRIVRTRPPRTHSVLFAPATLVRAPVETQVSVALVRTRPRPTTKLLTSVIYAQRGTIRATLVRTRPRPTRHFLTATSYAATSRITVALVHTRPRPTTRFLTFTPGIPPPAVTQTRVTLVHTRPRPTTRVLRPAIFRPQTGTVTTRLVAVQVRVQVAARIHNSPVLTSIPPAARSGVISVTLAVQAPLGALRRPARHVLHPPTILHIPITVRIAGPPETGWLTRKPEADFDTEAPEGGWVPDGVDTDYDADTPNQGWEADKPQ